MLHLEGVNFIPTGQLSIFDLIPMSFQQVLRLETIGAHVISHHHTVQRCGFGGGIFWHDLNPWKGRGCNLETRLTTT
jgi:hypothetical protein